MENLTGDFGKAGLTSPGELADHMKLQINPEKKMSDNVMSIRLSPDGIIIKDENSSDAGDNRLAGVYCEGIQYYDLKGVEFINHTGMAILIDLLKSLLEIGVDVQFVNVDEKIKNKIRQMGLEKVINCGEKK